MFSDPFIATCLSWQLSLSNRNNGTCYRQCQGRSVLLSSTSSSAMPLSSSLGWRSGTEGKGGLSHCLWVLSVTENLAPCLPRQLCPPVALTLNPDSHTHCKVSINLTSLYTRANEHVTCAVASYFSVHNCFRAFPMFCFAELFCLRVWWPSSFPGQWSCTFRSQPDWSILWHHKDSAHHCGGHLRFPPTIHSDINILPPLQAHCKSLNCTWELPHIPLNSTSTQQII